jgi:hypothetical protein
MCRTCPAGAISLPFFAFQAPFPTLRRIPIACQNAFRYSTTIPQHLLKPTLKEYIMNIAKNMEVIFVAAAIIAGATSFATAADGRVDVVLPADKVAVVAKADVGVPSVIVSAKRLTAAEKAAL